MFRHALCAVTLLSVITLGCQPAAEPEAAAPPDPAPINALRDSYASAYAAGDAAMLEDLYTDDAVTMDNHRPMVEGKQAILASAQAMFEQAEVDIQINPVETEIMGDWAYDRGTYSITITPKGDGDAMQDAGNYIVILSRGADGTWRIHREIGNSSQPMMPATE